MPEEEAEESPGQGDIKVVEGPQDPIGEDPVKTPKGRRKYPDLRGKILTFLEHTNPKSQTAVATHLSSIAYNPGRSTLYSCLKDMVEDNTLVHLTGYTVNREVRAGQIKTYIFIETRFQEGKTDKNYQDRLKEDIEREIESGKYKDMHLISVEIVLGADLFELIVVVTADALYPIGQFVKGFLREHQNVVKTRTVLVWPSQPPAKAEETPQEQPNTENGPAA